MNYAGLTDKQKDFLNRVWKAASASCPPEGIPVEVTVAQAIIESNWGAASIGNNIFGIKAGSSWKGKKQLRTTNEFEGGKMVKHDLWFRDYDSLEASVQDHNTFLKGDRYRWCFSKPCFYRDQVLLKAALAKHPNADDPKRFEAIQAIPRQPTFQGHPVPAYVHFAQRLHEAGYATDPDYSGTIIAVIRKRLV